MTRENAERTANIILGVAGAAIALLVLRNRAMRKAAFTLGRAAVVTGGPVLLKKIVKSA